jgi:hypothetical protein
MRKRGGRAKRQCERVSKLVDRGLTGKRSDVIFSFARHPEGRTNKREHSAPLYSVLVEISHLADEKQNPESKRGGRRFSAGPALFFFVLASLTSCLLFVLLVVGPPSLPTVPASVNPCRRYSQFHLPADINAKPRKRNQLYRKNGRERKGCLSDDNMHGNDINAEFLLFTFSGLGCV